MTTTSRVGRSGGSNLPARVETVSGEVLDATPARVAEAQLKEALREGKNALWKAAEAAWHFDQAKGWAALGYDNLTRWLEDPEIDMTRGTYYRFVSTWQKLAVDKGLKLKQLEGVDMSKAALVADEIASGDVRPATALKDIQEMPASALREKYGKARRGRPPKDATDVQHAPGTALKAAADLPWDWIEQAVSGRAPIQLREARLREALQALIGWKEAFLDI